MRIGQLAAQLGLNPKTIRYYEEIGLLRTPKRTSAGYRLYDPASREVLQFILKAKTVGLTLQEISEVLELRRKGERPCEHVLTWLDSKLGAVDQQLRELAEFRRELASLREEAAETMGTEAPVCGIIEHHQPPRQDLPAPAQKAPSRRRSSRPGRAFRP